MAITELLFRRRELAFQIANATGNAGDLIAVPDTATGGFDLTPDAPHVRMILAEFRNQGAVLRLQRAASSRRLSLNRHAGIGIGLRKLGLQEGLTLLQGLGLLHGFDQLTSGAVQELAVHAELFWQSPRMGRFEFCDLGF